VRGRRADAIAWSEDLLVVDGRAALGAALAAIRSAAARWIVIRRPAGPALYAFRMEELLAWPPLVAALQSRSVNLRAPLDSVLGLTERTGARSSLGAPRCRRSTAAVATGVQAPSIERYIEVVADDLPRRSAAQRPCRGQVPQPNGSGRFRRAVATADARQGTDWHVALGATATRPRSEGVVADGAERAGAADPRSGRAGRVPPLEDEGTTSDPASVDRDRPTVDPRHAGADHDRSVARGRRAHAGAHRPRPQAGDWSALELTVAPAMRCARDRWLRSARP
jgi:hypothetical protein